MKMQVPTPEESANKKREQVRRFVAGFVAGIVIFGLLGSRILWYGLESVNPVTWIALGIGALSFGFLSMKFGHEFWQRLFGTH